MWIPQPPSADKAKGGKGEADKAGASPAKPSSKKTSEGKAVPTETKEKHAETASKPMLANSGAMSTFVGAFEVTSKLTGHLYQCRFSHMWNGIATRHADTIDTKFFVDGAAQVVGLAHTAFVKFRDRFGRDLTDREASFVAAEFLRERLEQEDERPLYDVPQEDVLRLVDYIGIK
jgi:hypothetical protein